MSTKVLDLDFSQPLSSVWNLEDFHQLQVLVRYHQKPLGWIYLPVRHQIAVTAEQLQQAATEQLGWELMAATVEQQFLELEPQATMAEPISIIVCTRDRASALSQCLQSLLALDYPSYEIIVVDRTPSNDDTAQLVAQLPVRYVRESQPGLAWARNRGIAAARHGLVAFIDDDVTVDKFWLQAIARAFADSKVMAVTGLAAPAELQTQAQYLYELHYGGMKQRLQRRTVCKTVFSESRIVNAEVPNRNLLWTNLLGTSANMAFRRSIFSELGGFDGALGDGTPSRGGDELEMFHRLLAQGHTLVYEPAAIAWHTAEPSLAQLRREIFRDNCGFGAHLVASTSKGRVHWLAVGHVMLYQWFLQSVLRRFLRPNRLSRSLIALEVLGLLVGAFSYSFDRLRSQRIENIDVEVLLDSASAPEAVS
ncbi:glycosyltransferase [Trichocoleus sp. FACHB-591]|uniref:glycosyltransferase n=1 Tax=Trichocoleus sp. FACHB-591 TaxID=2692872 RepID=UPI0016829E5A|nr:glycosyltransferase family 2 protein [Trichocoleus sp. FACHB-591]MBD2098853.1 glycosyltransferase [Trichocoleus sp. FACHB-591]